MARPDSLRPVLTASCKTNRTQSTSTRPRARIIAPLYTLDPPNDRMTAAIIACCNWGRKQLASTRLLVSDYGFSSTTTQIQGLSGVVVRIPESEGRCVRERQARSARCTEPFVPGFCLSNGVATFRICLRFLSILIQTAFMLRPPLCGNGDECKAGLTCGLFNDLCLL